MRSRLAAAAVAVVAMMAAGSPAAAAGTAVQLFSGRSVLALAAFGDGVYAGTDGGLLVARNGGRWTEVPGPLRSARVNALLATPGRLFAGGDSAVLSSGDGASWTVTGLTGRQVDSLAASGSSVFAGTGTERGGDGFVQRSQDGGASWFPAAASPATMGLPGEAVQAILPTAPGPVLAGTAGGGLYSSTDGGSHWFPSQRGLDNPWITAVVDDGSELLTGTDDGLYRSVDGGASWTSSAFPIPDPWIQALVPAGGSTVAGTIDGAVVLRANSRWQVVVQGLPSVYSLLPFAGGYLAGTADGLYCVACGGSGTPPRGAPAPAVRATRPGLALVPTPRAASANPGAGGPPVGVPSPSSTPARAAGLASGGWAAPAVLIVLVAIVGAGAWILRRRRDPLSPQ